MINFFSYVCGLCLWRVSSGIGWVCMQQSLMLNSSHDRRILGMELVRQLKRLVPSATLPEIQSLVVVACPAGCCRRVPSNVVVHHTLADVCLPMLCIKCSERYLASVLYDAGKFFVSVLHLPVCACKQL